jgi:hypothetical protein
MALMLMVFDAKTLLAVPFLLGIAFMVWMLWKLHRAQKR